MCICVRWNDGISGRKIKEWEIGYKDVPCLEKIETDFIMWEHRAIGLLALLAILVSVHAEGKTIFLFFSFIFFHFLSFPFIFLQIILRTFWESFFIFSKYYYVKKKKIPEIYSKIYLLNEHQFQIAEFNLFNHYHGTILTIN